MIREKSKKENIVHRLKIAKGHLEKVLSMVESDAYCIDIVHQSIAVQSALKEIDSLVLEDHLKNCVANSIKKGESSEVINEVMKVFDKR